jgi:rRNA maturation protein Rpf1
MLIHERHQNPSTINLKYYGTEFYIYTYTTLINTKEQRALCGANKQTSIFLRRYTYK